MTACLPSPAASTRPMGGPAIDHQAGLTVPRRSLYFQHAAEKQMEFLQIFDGAGRDRVLPPQGEHPAPASPGPGQQRPVAAPGPPARAHALDASRLRFRELRDGRVRTGARSWSDRCRTRRVSCVFSGQERRARKFGHGGTASARTRTAKLPRPTRPCDAGKAWFTCS